jgi:hypothetical protein
MRIFSKGFIYRTGMRIKDIGERVGHVKICGVFIFSRFSKWITLKGLNIKESVSNCPVSEL